MKLQESNKVPDTKMTSRRNKIDSKFYIVVQIKSVLAIKWNQVDIEYFINEN